MISLCDENYLWVEKLILNQTQSGRLGVTSAPLMLLETERNGFIFTNYFVDLKTMNSCNLRVKVFPVSLHTFRMVETKIHLIHNDCQRSLSEARVEKSRHAGRDGRQGGAADDRSTDVAACHRRMALTTVTGAGVKIVHFLATSIFLGTRNCWIRIIGDQQC